MNEFFLLLGIVGSLMFAAGMIMRAGEKRRGEEREARQALAVILGSVDPKSPEGMRILEDRANTLAEKFMQGCISDAEVAEGQSITRAATVLEINI